MKKTQGMNRSWVIDGDYIVWEEKHQRFADVDLDAISWSED